MGLRLKRLKRAVFSRKPQASKPLHTRDTEMLLITKEDRDRVQSALDAIRAASVSMPRILPDEVRAANTVSAGTAEAMIILANLRPATDVIHDIVEEVFGGRCPRAAAENLTHD